jgi:hypothetical protein
VHYIHQRFCLPTDVVTPEPRTPSQGQWRGRATPTKPSVRMSAAMAYDPNRKEVVLFGGSLSVPGPPMTATAAGTWILSSAGGGWIEKGGATQPAPRNQPTMTFDSTRGRIVLMGDASDTSVWEWDGTVWSARAPTAPMPPLGLNEIVRSAYDSTRSRVVVWTRDGIWDWNGTTGTFTQRESAPPVYVGVPTRREDTLFFDPASGHIIGFSSTATWEWNPGPNTFTNLGAAPSGVGVITQIAPATFAAHDGRGMWTWARGQAAWVRSSTVGTGPLRRDGRSMVFDPTRAAVVIFGGVDYDQSLGSGVRVYADPASRFQDIHSNTTIEWLTPAQ